MANRIKELREERMEKEGSKMWSQEALAFRIGTTRWSLADWESGKTKPRKFFSRRLAKAFGVTVEDLDLE